MKKLVLMSLLVMFGAGIQAQNMMEQRIAQEKEKYINEKLSLPDEKKLEFWKVYTEFQQKRRDIRIDITQNRLGLGKSTLTDEEAERIISNELEFKKALVELEAEYVDKYKTVLTPKEIVVLYKAEDDFNKVVMQRLRQMRGNQGNPQRRRN